MNDLGSNSEHFVLGKEPPQEAPCQKACPLKADIPRYLRLVADGKFADAASVIRERNPFPSICGRACLNFCELQCPVTHGEGAIMIRAVERFVAQRDTGLWKSRVKVGKATGKKVAVIGAGPAGLTAAYYLVKQGHGATVFEVLPFAGGMLRFGVPEYRLPLSVLNQEIQNIMDMGIDLKLNSPVKDLDVLLQQGFDAVLLALGRHEGVGLPIPGNDLPEVLVNIDFLRGVRMSEDAKNGPQSSVAGRHVIVLGGGDVAMDCARTALRLGAAKVEVVCLEGCDAMPAHLRELKEAEEEGVIIYNDRTASRILEKDGHVAGVETLNVTFMEFDSCGCLTLQTEPGSEQILPCDVVIFAVGQRPGLACIPENAGIQMTPQSMIDFNPDTLATTRPGVFAAGDIATTQPASATWAIAAGRQAAMSIDKYLGGTGDIEESLSPAEGDLPPMDREAIDVERASAPLLPLEERLSGFPEVELGLDEQTAMEQAKRCLRCDRPIMINMDSCSGCVLCAIACSFFTGDEEKFNPFKAKIKVSRQEKQNDFFVELLPECINCGFCTKYCNYNAIVRS